MSKNAEVSELIDLEYDSPWLEQYIDELQGLLGLEEALKQMRYKCHKHRKSQPCDDIPDPVTMAGGYHAALCLKHRNEWRTVIHDTVLWRDFHLAKAKLEASIQRGERDERIEELTDELMQVEEKLWNLSVSWIEEGKDKEDLEEQEASDVGSST
jgi:hypothetical protein